MASFFFSLHEKPYWNDILGFRLGGLLCDILNVRPLYITEVNRSIFSLLVALAEKRLMDVKLGQIFSWLGTRDFTPNGLVGAVRRGNVCPPDSQIKVQFLYWNITVLTQVILPQDMKDTLISTSMWRRVALVALPCSWLDMLCWATFGNMITSVSSIAHY